MKKRILFKGILIMLVHVWFLLFTLSTGRPSAMSSISLSVDHLTFETENKCKEAGINLMKLKSPTSATEIVWVCIEGVK